MKKLLLSIFALTTISLSAQVVVNGNLDTWTDIDPDGWSTLNIVTQFGGDQTTFQESSEVGEGTSSARLVTGNCAFCVQIFGTDKAPGLLQQSAAISYRPDTIYFLFKTGDSIGGQFLIDFSLTNQGNPVGSVQISGNQIIPVWSPQAFAVNYDSTSSATPDTLNITFASGSALFGGAPDVVGDSIFVDAVSVSSAPSSINELLAADIQVYPTNAIDNITVEKDVAGTLIFDVYDALGKVVASELIKNNRSVISVANYQAGMYFYQIRDLRNQTIDSGKFMKN